MAEEPDFGYRTSWYFFDNADLPIYGGYDEHVLGLEDTVTFPDSLNVYVFSHELDLTTAYGNIIARQRLYPGEWDGAPNKVIDFEDETFLCIDGFFNSFSATATASILPDPVIDGMVDTAGFTYYVYSKPWTRPVSGEIEFSAFWINKVNVIEVDNLSGQIQQLSYEGTGNYELSRSALYCVNIPIKTNFKMTLYNEFPNAESFFCIYLPGMDPDLNFNCFLFSEVPNNEYPVESVSCTFLNSKPGYYYFRVLVPDGQRYTFSFELI